jgi:hypothetical protein
MTTGTRRVVGLVSALALVSCGGDANAPPEAASDAATAPPAQTTFARKLGGAGLEWGLGLAAAPDGGLVAVSGIGGFMNRPQQLGISRLDAAGRTSWARAYGTGTAEVRVAAVAVSPLGNVFLALHVTGSTYPSGSLDLGGGPTEGDVVVKLAPDGRFVWQRFLSGPISSLAVDGSGSALVGYLDVGDLGTEARALKIRWDDALLWQRAVTEPEGLTDQVAVAWDPAGNAVVGNGRTLWRLDPDGRFLWAIRLDAPHAQIWWVGATAKGTVVASGQYDASLAYAGTRLVPPATAVQGWFALAAEADGSPRWLRARTAPGPIAVHPEGRLALLDQRFQGACGDEVARWDLTGLELWRRKVARCDTTAPFPALVGRALAVAPDQGVWVQGDSTIRFDAGTGPLVPARSDWFVVRVAP